MPSLYLQDNPFVLLRFYLVILCCVVWAGSSRAQGRPDSVLPAVPDTLAVGSQPGTPTVTDTLKAAAPAISQRPLADTAWSVGPASFQQPVLFGWQVLRHHPWFDFRTRPVSVTLTETVRTVKGKEQLFYLLMLLLLTLAVLRQAFAKYFSDLFRVFFRTTLKQRQIREQLMQTPLPSLLLNVFFVGSAGLYLAFVLEHYQLDPFGNFWILYLYCAAGLSAAYLVKFLGLRIAGWLFSVKELAHSYVFIVFIINKMIGLLLVPFLVVLAFATGDVYAAGLTLSVCLLGMMLLYRVFLSFAAFRTEVRIGLFHFLLYVAAFEITPLLLVYKALLLYFRITA